jgi:hypothetical protein
MTHPALILSLILCLASATHAQAPKKPPVTTSSLCTRDNAVDTTKQQLLLTRTFDNVVQRVAVLLRAADLLWSHEQDKAMAAFMEAFDLAVQNYKEVGDQTRRVSQSQFAAQMRVPDQRFKVISAIAKRDPVTARKLSEKMLQDDAREAEEKPAADDQSKTRIAEKLLTVANGLIATDVASALNFARQSLRYPATLQLPSFFYELSKTNRAAADQFYLEALNAYGATPMDQFLYLSSYPFGNTREAGEMPSYSIYRIPDGFVPNRALQRQFMQALLARIDAAMELPVETPAPYRYSDHAQMWLALNRLESRVQTDLPDLFDSAVRSKDRLLALLNPTVQKRVNTVFESENAPKKSFDELIEAAEKLTDVDQRDRDFTMAIISSAKDQTADRVISVIDKISDAGVREALANWFYYFHTQALIAGKNLTEARKFASKIAALDQRAYLYTRMAEESLKVAEDQTEARDLLNDISDAVGKAPKTIVSARALLALAYLYSKIDTNRGIEELGHAVKIINELQSPDFSQQFVMMKIEGKQFASYASISTPGFNPENAFREMGKLDFDGSLMQATNFSDKSLRALTTLSVIEPCLAIKPTKKRK